MASILFVNVETKRSIPLNSTLACTDLHFLPPPPRPVVPTSALGVHGITREFMGVNGRKSNGGGQTTRTNGSDASATVNAARRDRGFDVPIAHVCARRRLAASVNGLRQSRPSRHSTGSARSPSSSVILRVGDGVAAAEPAREVDVGAAARAERADSAPRWRGRRSGTCRGRRAVGACHADYIGAPGSRAGGAPHSGSASPSRSQLKWIGKPSPSSMLTTSVSGRPTTLV